MNGIVLWKVLGLKGKLPRMQHALGNVPCEKAPSKRWVKTSPVAYQTEKRQANPANQSKVLNQVKTSEGTDDVAFLTCTYVNLCKREVFGPNEEK